jgi:hypothetical protein
MFLVPADQLGQKNELGKELYFPVAQEVEWLPDSFWNFPAGQGSHSLLIWYLPSGQLRQKPRSETRPILHGRHIGTGCVAQFEARVARVTYWLPNHYIF